MGTPNMATNGSGARSGKPPLAVVNSYSQPIFVCGLPRSGSTLLELTLSNSPGVLRLAEPLYLSPWRRDFRYFVRHRVGDLRSDDAISRLVDILFASHDDIPGITGSFWRFRGIKAIDERELKERLRMSLMESDRSWRSIFHILLREITVFNGCTRCSVPFPVHVSYLPTLMQWFPEAPVVHLTRDPRAIAISKTNDPGGTATYNDRWPHLRAMIRKAMIAFVVIQYWQASRAHARFKKSPKYLLVQYEDMVMRPVETIRSVCEFAGIQFSERMLQQATDRAQRSSITGEMRPKADAAAASRWKSVITPFERAVVTLLTWRSMRRFGFDPETHPVYSTRMMDTRQGVDADR